MPKPSTPTSTQPCEVRVNLGERSYSIHIGNGILQQLAEQLRIAVPKSQHALIVFDSQIKPLAVQVGESLEQANWRCSLIEIPSGENSKSLERAGELWQTLLAERTDRGSCVVAVGGGVVGDLAGFAAASFARGIPLVQIPTTLLSQVDSSVGGKTGINLPGAKNIVGAFWQPSLVLIDSETLLTLPQREYVSGLAEVVKYGVILLPELFEYLENNAEAILAKDPSAIAHIVAESCRAKARVVEEDERETSGRRAILNYGHTFAHAIESVTGYGQLLHGEAVSIGMHMAACLALRLGFVDQGFVDRQHALLQALQLPTSYSSGAPQELWTVMQRDKKVSHGKLRFILPKSMGMVELVSGITEADACAAIEAAAH